MINSIKILHDMGYVHNDIKPENVMLGCSDPVGES